MPYGCDSRAPGTSMNVNRPLRRMNPCPPVSVAKPPTMVPLPFDSRHDGGHGIRAIDTDEPSLAVEKAVLVVVLGLVEPDAHDVAGVVDGRRLCVQRVRVVKSHERATLRQGLRCQSQAQYHDHKWNVGVRARGNTVESMGRCSWANASCLRESSKRAACEQAEGRGAGSPRHVISRGSCPRMAFGLHRLR